MIEHVRNLSTRFIHNWVYNSSKVNVLHFHFILFDLLMLLTFPLKSALFNFTIHKAKKNTEYWQIGLLKDLYSFISLFILRLWFFSYAVGSFIILTIEKNSLNSAESEARKHTHFNCLSCKISSLMIKEKRKKNGIKLKERRKEASKALLNSFFFVFYLRSMNFQ